MSSRRWQQFWPRYSTILLHGARGRPRQERGARDEVHGAAPEEAPSPSSPPLKAAGAQYFSIIDDELVLDTAVP